MFTSNIEALRAAVQEWLPSTTALFSEIQTDDKWIMISLSDSSSLTDSKSLLQKQVNMYPCVSYCKLQKMLLLKSSDLAREMEL